ncbi:g5566 [Coccomyxa viridis]|uniref:G5566 protein n=1 Tax=Coccomyxa viridis TaxID=1274662 RepID=A0ABP1FT65_9CHLO
MKRATNTSRQASIAAGTTLSTNNPATQLMVEALLLQQDSPLTMALVERWASADLHENLITLAKQCAAAGCQPLEVFTRSVQCTTRERGVPAIIIQRNSQGQSITREAGWCQETVQVLQQLGAQRSVADLIVAYLQVLTLPRDYNDMSALRTEFVLDHMLPGTITALADIGPTTLGSHTLIKAVPSFAAALQAYQMRAAQCGRSFEHMVLLEAAVQGWSIDTPDAGNLLRAIIAAEPAVNPTRTQQPITLAMPPHVLDADVTEGANTMEMGDRADSSMPGDQEKAPKPESVLSKGFFTKADKVGKNQAK